MAHLPQVKAKAMSMLITGDTVGYVSRTLGVPKQTVSRWKPEADAFLRKIVAASPELRATVAMIRQMLPGLQQNGTKKKGSPKRGR